MGTKAAFSALEAHFGPQNATSNETSRRPRHQFSPCLSYQIPDISSMWKAMF